MAQENLPAIHQLSPRADLLHDPNYKLYKDRLNEILKDTNRDIHNVALIGERGTGKSSILQTFNKDRIAAARKQSKNPFKGMLFVSLIDFEDRAITGKTSDLPRDQEASHEDELLQAEETSQNEEQSQVAETSQKDEPSQVEEASQNQETPQGETQKRLECSILKQILVRCSDDDLKNSRLRSIVPAEPRKLTKQNILGIFTYLVITGLIFGLIFEERFGLLLRQWNMSDHDRVFFHTLGYVLLFLFAFILGVHCWRTRTYLIRLSKLTFKHNSAEAEFTTMDQKYCLDEYKFEILHILDKLAPRIGHTVVFEDMERLDSSMCLEIMTKLRELNDLVNTYRAERDPNAEPIRFIYALDDQVFTYKNRIKFFDVVLPLVPRLNHASFSSRFCAELKNVTNVNPGSEIRKMIDGLKGDLFDYRLVLSSINEYLLFRSMYVNHQTERNELYQLDDWADACILAIAIYKTLCPAKASGLFCSGTEEPFAAPNPSTEPKQYKVFQYLADGGYLRKNILKWILYPYGEIAQDWEKQLNTGTWEDRIEVARTMCESNTSIFSEDKRFLKIFENAKDPELARYLGRVIFQHNLDAIVERIKEISKKGIWTQTLFTSYLAALHNFYDVIPDELSEENQTMLANWCYEQLEKDIAVPPNDKELAEVWDSRWLDGLALVCAACLSTKLKADNSTPTSNSTPASKRKGKKRKNTGTKAPQTPKPEETILAKTILGGKSMKEWINIFNQRPTTNDS